MSTPENWFTKIYESKDLLKTITYAIRRKANACNELGFGNLSEDLYSYASQIDDEVITLIDLVEDNIHTEFQNSQKSIAETLKVLLEKPKE